VVFDEDNFSLVASPNLTELDFLLESGSTVFTIGTRLPLVGSTTMAACQPAPVVPPGFEPLVTPLPTSAVPPGFLPRAALTTHVVLHVAQSSPAVPGTATLTPAAPRAAPESPTAPRVASADGNKSLYLVFVGVVFSQHLGLLLEQLGQHLALLLEQLGQQHLGCFVRTTAF
jgi:hypothetical protein